MMVNGHHKKVLQPTPSANITVSYLHIIPPLTSLNYPERFNSSNLQAMVSGAHAHYQYLTVTKSPLHLPQYHSGQYVDQYGEQ